MRIGLIASIILLTACSTQEVFQSAQYSKKTYLSEKPIGLDATVTWKNDQRAGAAYKAEAYAHVLGQQNSDDIVDIPPTSTSSLDHLQSPSDTIESVMNKGYSVYELQRWERFCGKGKMNSKDWDFIATEGRYSLPEYMKSTCTPPAFSRQEYIHTWKAFCHDDTLTKEEKYIVESTKKPHDTCDV